MQNITRLLASLTACLLFGCADSRPYTEESVIRAQQSQRRTTAATSTPATSIPVAAPAPSPVVEQYYSGEDMEHLINLVMELGAKVKLEDGSIWEIAPKYRPQTELWRVTEKIVVTRDPVGQYRFKMTNRVRNTSVDARLISTGQGR